MTKSTRRALLSSVVALVLCLTMLIGTTFAWFTDTASTAVNSIVSGTLDVELGKYDDDGKWVSLEGKTLDFVKADGAPADEEILWEPGCEYNLETVVIRNNGNLALKYTVVVSGIDGDAKLNEAIEWEINVAKTNDVTTTAETGETVKFLLPNEEATLTISGHMKEEAGNEYQGLTIDGAAITVIATQDTVEYDSYDNQYDANALKVITYGDDVNNISLKSTVVDSDRIWNNLYGEDGYSANGHHAIVFNSGDLNACFEDCIFLCDVGNVYSVENGALTFKDCTFYGWVHFGDPTGANITFVNCTFTNTCDVKIGSGAASVTFTDCTFDYKPTIVDDTTTYSYPMECGRIMLWSNATFSDCTILRDIYEGNSSKATLTDCVAVTTADFVITTADDFTAFAESVKNGNTYSGKTVLLATDIDMKNVAMAPIGNVYSTTFHGTFDGCGNTIYNLKVVGEESDNANYGTGLFGWLDGTVKNLTVDGATVTDAHHYAGVIAGYIQFGSIENCTVINSAVTSTHKDDDQCGDKVGGVVGYVASGAKVSDCHVEDTAITAGRDAGYVVGCTAVADKVVNCTATNVTLTEDGACERSGENMKGEIYGRIG